MSATVMFLTSARGGGQWGVAACVHAEDEKCDDDDWTGEADDVVAIECDGPEACHQQIGLPRIVAGP